MGKYSFCYSRSWSRFRWPYITVLSPTVNPGLGQGLYPPAFQSNGGPLTGFKRTENSVCALICLLNCKHIFFLQIREKVLFLKQRQSWWVPRVQKVLKIFWGNPPPPQRQREGIQPSPHSPPATLRLWCHFISFPSSFPIPSWFNPPLT